MTQTSCKFLAESVQWQELESVYLSKMTIFAVEFTILYGHRCKCRPNLIQKCIWVRFRCDFQSPGTMMRDHLWSSRLDKKRNRIPARKESLNNAESKMILMRFVGLLGSNETSDRYIIYKLYIGQNHIIWSIWIYNPYDIFHLAFC